MTISALWAMIKYVDPIKYIKYCYPNAFIKKYISLCSFKFDNESPNNYNGNYSPFFESIETGLYIKTMQIKDFNIKNGERKIIKYISQDEQSTLFVFYINEKINNMVRHHFA